MTGRRPLGHRCRCNEALVIALGAAIALTVAAPASAEQRAIDTERSTITVRVFKTGIFRAFADDHVIQAPIKEGSVDDGASPHVRVVVDAGRLHVLDPGLSPRDREQVQARMLGPDVLDVNGFPQICFESVSVQRIESDGWLVRGHLTLHGQTRKVTVKVVMEGGRYKGSTEVKQTDFGMVPVKVAAGTVKVKDAVTIDFDIATRP
jgi:hypothetical protein